MNFPINFLAFALASATTLPSFAATDTLAPLREAPQILLGTDLGIGRMLPDLEFVPVSGKAFRVSQLKSAPATVIALTSTSCPLAKRFAPTLAALEQEFAARGVKFVFVNPIASDSAASIAEAIRTHRFAGPYAQDPRARTAAALGARSTCEVFVLDAARTLIYRGAIDDQYGLGYSLDAPRHRYLADALVAHLAGQRPVSQATTAPGCALDLPQKKTTTATDVTYHNRISRIVQQHCLECHHAGGVAPFTLETHEDLSSHAGEMRKQLTKGAMPPWFAAPLHDAEPSPWVNDRTLPAQDKADLLAWLRSDRTVGDPADAPLPKMFPKDWEIGEPDAIVQLPEPVAVKATGKMPYQNIIVETKFTEDRWVRAMEVRPTAREVVHHALIYVVPPERLEKARAKGGDTDGGNFFAVYVPGNSVRIFPDGFAKLVPAGAALHFQIHYTPTGTATHDQMRLGLRFSKEPPRHEVRVAAVAAKLEIPPGAENYEARGLIPVPFDAKLLSFMPHMHVRGKAYRYELQTPNGRKRMLLDVPRYDFNWQLQYRLREPADAPAGSAILGTAWYDNSAKNPANPDPTQTVKWGEQTEDEMMLGYFEFYVPSIEPSNKPPNLIEMALRDGGLIFNGMDKNRDGVLTIEEAPTPQQFTEADSDSDGKVTRDEFRIIWQQKQSKPAPST